MRKIAFLLIIVCSSLSLIAQEINQTFLIKPSDSVGLLLFNKTVFKGTKAELLKLFPENKFGIQPNNPNAAVIVTYNPMVGGTNKNLFIKTANGWERAIMIDDYLIRDIKIRKTEDGLIIVFEPLDEGLNGNWFKVGVEYTLIRDKNGWRYEDSDAIPEQHG